MVIEIDFNSDEAIYIQLRNLYADHQSDHNGDRYIKAS